MTDTDKDDRMLEALFDTARADRTPPPRDWLARVTGDALAEAAGRRAPAMPTPGPLGQLAAILGGWRGVGGLAAAGIAGVAIGVWDPATVGAPFGAWSVGAHDMLRVDDVALADFLDGG